MDDAMTRRSATGRDFEDRFFELLLKRMDDQDEKLDEIVKQTRKTNGRVTKLEDKVEQIEKVAVVLLLQVQDKLLSVPVPQLQLQPQMPPATTQ